MIQVSNAVIKHQLTILRNKNTNSQLFCSCLKSISQYMCYVVTKDLKTKKIKISTPICGMVGEQIVESVILVPILRAGLGIVDAFKEMIPNAKIGHIGLYRDTKLKKTICYYCKMPNSIKGSTVIILDPMLATGHSVCDAIDKIKKFKPKRIKFVSIISAPEGIKYVEHKHKDVQCYTVAIDKKLDKHKYIVPGCGDAGDRLFGTK